MGRLVVVRFVVFVLFVSSHCATDGGANAVDSGPREAREGSVEANVISEDPLDDGTPIGQNEEPSTEDRLELFQYDPVKLGHVHRVADESGRIMELVTIALDPPIFEIRHFLSDEECDHVIELAKETGLENSGVVLELLPSLSDGSEDEIIHIFKDLDVDEDSLLGPAELADGLMDIAGGLLSEEDVSSLLADLELDPDGDQQLDFQEFKLSWTPDVEKSVNKWVKDRQASNDTFRFSSTRVSEQTWLDQSWFEDDTLTRLHERVVRLVQLPKDIVLSSESLQVVRYQVGGHYHAHYDSCELDDTLTCSHTGDVAGSVGDTHGESPETESSAKESEASAEEEEEYRFDSRTFRLCRYATVLFYLNDVEEGGETAFPIADNETYSEEAFETMPYSLYDLTYHCYDSNLVVKAEKGKAILWYNHLVNTSNDWMGDSYNSSLHGGCDVRKGEKWIANNWINIDDNYQKQMDYHEFFHRELMRSKEQRVKEKEEKQSGEQSTEDGDDGNIDDSSSTSVRDEL